MTFLPGIAVLILNLCLATLAIRLTWLSANSIHLWLTMWKRYWLGFRMYDKGGQCIAKIKPLRLLSKNPQLSMIKK